MERRPGERKQAHDHEEGRGEGLTAEVKCKDVFIVVDGVDTNAAYTKVTTNFNESITVIFCLYDDY